ncbi:MAG TPA: hypothetical protein VLR69_08890 [Thermoanaerobaculia bacterium]|nr:hypothetical protein [Thermoanaerobaculia bacterium]
MKAQAILVTLMAASLGAAASAQTNVLVNGDFETNPPATLGNNIGYPIAPWVLGTGEQSNVVTVDGPGGFDYGSAGPESDASAPGPGIRQHYLDIANGSNDFYQSFTPRCSGQVTFGGAFSTRGNDAGQAMVTLRQGVGTSGAIVGQTNTINLPGGNSKTDPWTVVSYTAQVHALTTYSFVAHMDNQMNFDNGFVRYNETCNPPNPCCPPWNASTLEDLLTYKGSGGIADPYTLLFQPTSGFNNQIQAYIDYVHAVSPANTTIVIAFRLNDGGTGSTATGGPQVGNIYFISWVAGGGGVPTGGNFFTLATESMQVNRWYRVNTGIFLGDGPPFFPDSCANNRVDVRVQVLHSLGVPGGRGQGVLQIRTPDGRLIERPLPPKR